MVSLQLNVVSVFVDTIYFVQKITFKPVRITVEVIFLHLLIYIRTNGDGKYDSITQFTAGNDTNLSNQKLIPSSWFPIQLLAALYKWQFLQSTNVKPI